MEDFRRRDQVHVLLRGGLRFESRQPPDLCSTMCHRQGGRREAKTVQQTQQHSQRISSARLGPPGARMLMLAGGGSATAPSTRENGGYCYGSPDP